MTTAPITTLSDPDLALIRQVHGHLCPMVLLGARTAVYALRLVKAAGNGCGFFAYYRGYGCAVDGIQLFSGCTWGNRNLVLLRGRDFSFILTAEGASKGVMVSPRPSLLEQIREERSPGSRSALMEMFGSSADEELFETGTVEDLAALSRYPGE